MNCGGWSGDGKKRLGIFENYFIGQNHNLTFARVIISLRTFVQIKNYKFCTVILICFQNKLWLTHFLELWLTHFLNLFLECIKIKHNM